MQKRANGAAVLTNAVNRAGFGTGFPALSREAAIVVRYHLESSVLGADPTMHQSSASSLSELVHELFDLATKPANDQIVRFSAQISDGVLRDLAVLRSGLAKVSALALLLASAPVFPANLLPFSPNVHHSHRPSHPQSSVLKWEPAPLGGPELADLLSHNLTVLRGIPSLGSLPDPAEMSLELLYGLILARWHGEAVEEVPGESYLKFLVPSHPPCPPHSSSCSSHTPPHAPPPLLPHPAVLAPLACAIPFLTMRPRASRESATRPSERRCVSLCSRISSGPWAPDFPDVSPEDSLSLSALRAALEEAVKERRVGATRRKKVRRILRSLERVLEDDAAWEVRRDVVVSIGEGRR